MGMGTENENEASFAKRAKVMDRTTRGFFPKKWKMDYAIKFSVSFRLNNTKTVVVHGTCLRQTKE
jgi:hypothetical protein